MTEKLTAGICRGCAKPLTDEERQSYDGICEECAWEWFERIDAWRKGGEDAELDKMFSEKRTIQ